MKPALVTGASSGIGAAVVEELVADGWQVLAVARRSQRLEDLRQKLGDAVVPMSIDVTQPDAPQRLIEEAVSRMGGLELLVNNAGMSYLGDFAQMPEMKIDELLDLNVRSLMKVCRAAISPLRESGGQIINVGSLAAHMPMTTIAVYCATKAAVITFSRVLAKELAASGIRVNCFSPTGTNTELFENVGSEVDASQFVSAEAQAKMLVSLTKLPDGLDVLEVITDQRFNPLVL